VAIYVGFDIPRTLGSEETGASVSLPIFVNFMKEALKDKPSTPFRVPNSVQFVKVDRETGGFATPETPKNRVFFEALKLNDNVESKSFFDSKDEDAEVQPSEETGETPSGIY
jgi:penicillin-binding protein 1A